MRRTACSMQRCATHTPDPAPHLRGLHDPHFRSLDRPRRRPLLLPRARRGLAHPRPEAANPAAAPSSRAHTRAGRGRVCGLGAHAYGHGGHRTDGVLGTLQRSWRGVRAGGGPGARRDPLPQRLHARRRSLVPQPRRDAAARQRRPAEPPAGAHEFPRCVRRGPRARVLRCGPHARGGPRHDRELRAGAHGLRSIVPARLGRRVHPPRSAALDQRVGA
jgi:hypothetical protein